MKEIINGETIKLFKNRQFTIRCCECRLTHIFFADKDVNIKIYRDDYLTNLARRKRGKKNEPLDFWESDTTKIDTPVENYTFAKDMGNTGTRSALYGDSEKWEVVSQHFYSLSKD